MKEEAVTSFTEHVDTVTSHIIDRVNKLEAYLLKCLNNQWKTYNDNISFRNKFVKKFYGYLSASNLQNNPLVSPISDVLNIQPIPEISKPVISKSAHQFNRNDIAKFLSRNNVSDTVKRENMRHYKF